MTETVHHDPNHTHVPLHQKLGSKLGHQDKSEKVTFLKVTRAYCDAIERGEISMPEHIMEIPVGGTKYFRGFVIDEAPSKA